MSGRSQFDIDRLILVDGEDRVVGEAGKAECHLEGGRKHRALAVVVFDGEGRLLLARRAAAKPLWPGSWDATIASHPRPGEDYVVAGRRRLLEELGVELEAELLGRFDYRIEFEAVGVEDEVCAALIARLGGDPPAPVAAEVDGIRAVTLEAFLDEAADPAAGICPWAPLAVLAASLAPSPPAELAALARPALRQRLIDAADAHLGIGGWRMLDAG
ncbi:NUDIX domain-containing protein [Engelhardtia mirabilis]